MRKKEHALSLEQVTRYKNYVMMQKSITKKTHRQLNTFFICNIKKLYV